MSIEIDKWLEELKKEKAIPENELRSLCERVFARAYTDF